jgi:mono/diheme cytochrome c family protein
MLKRNGEGHIPHRVAWVAGLALLAVLAFAKDGPADGKSLFKEYCKPCHAEGAKAGEYTPMTLIGDQWERFFETKYLAAHQAVNDTAHGNKPVTEAITPDMLKVLREWIVDHAADSEHPMTCG